jgi:hypothetical protein
MSTRRIRKKCTEPKARIVKSGKSPKVHFDGWCSSPVATVLRGDASYLDCLEPVYVATDCDISPTVSCGGCREEAFDVRDGKGHIVWVENWFYRYLVRANHLRYKATENLAEKHIIASGIYTTIIRKGGRFFDVDGKLNAEAKVIKKIKKALKDMKPTTNDVISTGDPIVGCPCLEPNLPSTPCSTLPRPSEHALADCLAKTWVPRPSPLSEPCSSFTGSWASDGSEEWILEALNSLDDTYENAYCDVPMDFEVWSAE